MTELDPAVLAARRAVTQQTVQAWAAVIADVRKRAALAALAALAPMLWELSDLVGSTKRPAPPGEGET